MWSKYILDFMGPDPFGEIDRALWIASLKSKWGLIGYNDPVVNPQQQDINHEQKEHP